jgi:predicted amidohydrolase YtcJ
LEAENGIVLKNVKCLANGKQKGVQIAVSGNRAWFTEHVPSGFGEIDLHNSTLLFGLTDTHCHLVELGFSKKILDLRDVSSIQSLRLKLFSHVQSKKEGEWVIGRGWDHEKFSEGRFPTKEDIDDVSKSNPTFLKRICGHVGLLNSLAIKVLGIENERSKLYERDENGNLTGIVKEDALENVSLIAEKKDTGLCQSYMVDGQYQAIKHGITKVHCILSKDSYVEEIEGIRTLASLGQLFVKLRLYLPYDAINRKEVWKSLNENTSVKVNGFKIFADGSLGSRTAALSLPYTDEPENDGILRYTDTELKEMVEKIDSSGMQAIIHAIGDRAIAQAIDAISSVDSKNRRRHRIEHASLTPKHLREEMSRKNIPASVQPHFIASDTWATKRLGERISDLYPLRAFIKEGVVISGGSDAPVEPINPMLGFWAAVVRPNLDHSEAISIQDCIKMYTENADYNGLDAKNETDFTIFDSDIENIHPSALRNVRPLIVVVNGKICFQSLF